MTHFGRNVRLLRQRLGLSQAGLAARMADGQDTWTQHCVSQRESSSRIPSGRFAEAVARALGVDVYVLLLPLEDLGGVVDRVTVAVRQLQPI